MPNRVIVKGNVGNALHSVAPDHILGTADEIFDESSQEYQSEINAGAVRADKDQSLTEEQKAKALENQGVVIAQGSDFTNPDATKRAKVPTVGAVLDGLNDGVYDVSKRNPTGGPNSDGKFTLEYILNNADTLIPTSRRHGGMLISFVDSSDNNSTKYVQYRLMKNQFSTTPADWQGVDDSLVKNSENLAKSGVVYEQIAQLDQKLIKLVGWDGNLSRSNVTGAGQYWFHSGVNKIYRCRTWNGSASSSTYDEITPQENGVYIFEGRYYRWNGTTLELVASKIMVLYGFPTTQGNINIGETYYNTSAKQLRRKTAQYDYVVVPFYEGTIYLYDNEIYVWNGTDMVKRGAEIVDNFNSSSSDKSISARCGKVLNDTKANLASVNLFNKNEQQITGKYVGSDGTLSSNADSITSYLIEIKPNTLYSWQGTQPNVNYIARFVMSDGTTGLHLLDDQGTELPYTGGMHFGLIKSPSNAKFFQFTIKFTDSYPNIADTACLIESTEIITQYFPYERVIPMGELPQIIAGLPVRVSALENNGKMAGKELYFCGDSIMNGILVPSEKRIYNQIAALSGGNANNLSKDGSLFNYPEQIARESILWQIMQIPQNADYIIFQGGVNGMNYSNPDGANYHPIGEMTNSYTSTFDASTQIGCLEQICKYLYENHSGKKIGFIITYQIGSGYPGYWNTKLEYLLPVLKKWSIPTLDWRNSGINLAANAVHYGFDGYANYDEFSESESYNTDDKVIHDNKLYKANEPISAGAWNSTQWTLVSNSQYDTWHCNELAYTMLADLTYEWMKTL